MKTAIATAAFGLVLTAAGIARADAIDGNWCSSDGKYLSIHGPQIVTPGGARLEGDYTRHGFVYVVPAPEPGNGQKAVLTLVSDHLMRYALGAGAPSEWKRCSPPTS